MNEFIAKERVQGRDRTYRILSRSRLLCTTVVTEHFPPWSKAVWDCCTILFCIIIVSICIRKRKEKQMSCKIEWILIEIDTDQS